MRNFRINIACSLTLGEKTYVVINLRLTVAMMATLTVGVVMLIDSREGIP